MEPIVTEIIRMVLPWAAGTVAFLIVFAITRHFA